MKETYCKILESMDYIRVVNLVKVRLMICISFIPVPCYLVLIDLVF